MKKKCLVAFAAVGLLSLTVNVNAQFKDQGQNQSDGTIKSSYNKVTGELSLYGSNKHGNLGTGNKSNLTKDKAIIVNSKIGNKKIIDYYINYAATYVLTEDNKVYTTGSYIADSYKGERTTFIDMYFYKGSSNPITSINGTIDIYKEKGKKYLNEYDLKFKTKKSNVHYEFQRYVDGELSYKTTNVSNILAATRKTVELIKKDDHEGVQSKGTISNYEMIWSSPYYVEKTKNKTYQITKSRKNEFFLKTVQSKSSYKTSYYEFGKIKRKSLMTPTRYDFNSYDSKERLVQRYQSKIIKNKLYERTTKYKKGIRKYSEYVVTKGSSETKLVKKKFYYNKKGKLILRKNYKANKKKKLKIVSKKWYKYRKSGKNYSYITYYKNGKASKTYKYELNKKGKVVKRKNVKLRK